MRLATVSQGRQIDKVSVQKFGLTDDILMESAGALAARELDQVYYPELKSGQTAIVCGPGHNGGDGLVMARHLYSMGHRNVWVYWVGPRSPIKSSVVTEQLRRAELQGIKIHFCEQTPEKLGQIKSSKLIVDALFGVGLNRPLEGLFLKAAELINSAKVPVISLDAPSGLDCDRGIAHGVVVKAHMTFAFGLGKPGFFVSDGPQHVGKLRVLPIGYSRSCLRQEATTHFLFTEKLARRYLPTRSSKSNKSDFGHVVVCAGSQGKWGAGILSASSAYRVGAGYVTWASFTEPVEVLKEVPEVLTAAIENIQWENLKSPTAVVGPGLGIGGLTVDLIEKLKSMGEKVAVVLDADAITTCVQENLFPLPSHWVLTPHSGELSRIIDKSVQSIEQDRFLAALLAAERSGCHVLLKGFRSVLASKHRVMVVNSGNSALAKAGTGDVLSGMIGGLLAQQVEPIQATATAAYIHGRMADEWVRSGHDRRSLLASDLTNHLPQLMARLKTGALV